MGTEKSKQTWQEIKAAVFRATTSTRAQRLFRLTGNDIHAWTTFQQARKAGIPIPNWILNYLDEFAATVTRSPGAAAKRFKKGGGPNAASRAASERRNGEIIGWVLSERERRPKKLDDEIFGEVGERFGLATETIKGIVYGEWAKEKKPRRAPKPKRET